MSSSSDKDRVPVCAVNPFSDGIRFQSSQPHLKRFVMFDHSNGKGRVFFHPAVAQEIFGSEQAHDWESKGLLAEEQVKAEYAASSLAAYKQMAEGAFTSLQSLRASRQKDAVAKNGSRPPLSALVSPQKPRVSESTAKIDGENWMLGAQPVANPQAASETLVCEEESKVLAILPSTETALDCYQLNIVGGSSNSNRSQISGLKGSVVPAASELMQENTEDLNALLSSDEDDDEDVQSTGHSPDESPGKDGSHSEEENDTVEQQPCKKRKTSLSHGVEAPSVNVLAVRKDLNFSREGSMGLTSRRQKIKRTVKALRQMIPGGTRLDTAVVLDKTITYVKALRDRVDQLEVNRRPSHFWEPCF